MCGSCHWIYGPYRENWARFLCLRKTIILHRSERKQLSERTQLSQLSQKRRLNTEKALPLSRNNIQPLWRLNWRSEWRGTFLSEGVHSHETPNKPGWKSSSPSHIHHVTRGPHSSSLPNILLHTPHKKYHLQTKLYTHDPRQGFVSPSTIQPNTGLQPRGKSHKIPSGWSEQEKNDQPTHDPFSKCNNSK